MSVSVRLVAILLLLLALLGVQRTPEANLGGVIASGVAGSIVVAGCVHTAATTEPDALLPLPPPANPDN